MPAWYLGPDPFGLGGDSDSESGDDQEDGGIWEGSPIDPVADTWKGFASGIERSSKRQFDDERGGGPFDVVTYIPGQQAPGEDANVPANSGMATAPPDERSGGFVTSVFGSVPRQFDDREGGGFAEPATEAVGDAAGGLTDVSVDVSGEVLGSVSDELPGWATPIAGVVAAIAVISLVAYAVGQLFTFEIGS